MSEVISQTPSPEQVVFGNAFSFANGESDEGIIKEFFTERLTSIKEGAVTWLPRALDSDSGVCADLYKEGKVAATLVLDYESLAASVYATNENGNFGDVTLCDQVSFADAVAAAEQSAA